MMTKSFKGQSLLEFSLVAPILILVLVIISELGYTAVIKNTIIDATKQSVQSANFMVGKYSTTKDMLLAMKADLEDYIKVHNLPQPDSLVFGIGEKNTYGTAVIISYTYKPSFRLIGITPEKITLQSSQIIPNALLKVNNPVSPPVM